MPLHHRAAILFGLCQMVLAEGMGSRDHKVVVDLGVVQACPVFGNNA
ncbi:MAG: hypothetical protein IIV58_07155 [Alistipes sp.]|nr:hypothetical protein [Alistipes sp.]